MGRLPFGLLESVWAGRFRDMRPNQLPIPSHFEPGSVASVWRVPYQERSYQAQDWRRRHGIQLASKDTVKVCLVAIDLQNTFCLPDFELFVAGRSGTGAVDDNRRLCEFIYRNLGVVTQVYPTLDTHQAIQIFHPIFLLDCDGQHPAPFTQVSLEDVQQGVWKVNPSVCGQLGMSEEEGHEHLLHYVKALRESEKYELTVWPYHGLLGGIGHALVSSVEEAIFFHGQARQSQPTFQIKGNYPLTEHYSALSPEVLNGPDGRRLGASNTAFLQALVGFDVIIIAGQAKSHCVAWTIAHLLEDPLFGGAGFAERVYLLEDCTSAVVVPEVIDYTDEAEVAFARFADAGMHRVCSTDPVENWPDVPL